jgi:m7GpppX diphosphatase
MMMIPLHCTRVDDILSGRSESHKVLYSDPCPTFGFLILPDMKWDLVTLSSLYLIAIIRSKNIQSLRDLRTGHLGMLRSIRREAARVVEEKWGLGPGTTKLFIHYQPSYCVYQSADETLHFTRR